MVLVQFVAVMVLLSHAVCVEVVLLQDMAVVVVDIYSMFACLFLLTILVIMPAHARGFF